MPARPAALWRCTDLSRFATTAEGIYYTSLLLRLPCLWEQPMTNEALPCVQHSVPWVQTPYPFQLCKDYFDILKGLCRYHRDDMSCQDFCTVCWKFFHPITPSVSSMWFLLSSTYMLYFLVFLFFFMISLIGNTIVRVLLYCGPQTPPLPCNRSLPVYKPWCIYQNNICFCKIVVNGFQVAGYAQLYFSF